MNDDKPALTPEGAEQERRRIEEELKACKKAAEIKHERARTPSVLPPDDGSYDEGDLVIARAWWRQQNGKLEDLEDVASLLTRVRRMGHPLPDDVAWAREFIGRIEDEREVNIPSTFYTELVARLGRRTATPRIMKWDANSDGYVFVNDPIEVAKLTGLCIYPVEPARVDADGTAKPKTEIVGHFPIGKKNFYSNAERLSVRPTACEWCLLFADCPQHPRTGNE